MLMARQDYVQFSASCLPALSVLVPSTAYAVPGSAGAVISKIEIEQNSTFVFRYCVPVPGTEFAGIKNSLYSVPIRLLVNGA